MNPFAIDFSVSNDWKSGFQGQIAIANNSTSKLNNWTLEFEAPFEIKQIWNAEIVSRQGNRYVIRNTNWNGNVDAGKTVSFGFTADPGNLQTEPKTFVLNGETVGTPIPTPVPNLSIEDVTVSEGNDGTAEATFEIELSQASSQSVTVEYATADGSAKAGSDYTATSGTVTFAPGETSKTVAVEVLGDTQVESNENFTLNLSKAANATLEDKQAVGTILNDDQNQPTQLQLSVDDITVTEGNSGAQKQAFTIELSAASEQAVTVDYKTADGTAKAGSDYTATSGTLKFAPGETSKTVLVPILGDTQAESQETFTLKLENATNATLADAQGIATLLDNDSVSSQQGNFNYAEVAQKSFLFYEAQRSGKLPQDNRIAWRGDSGLNDGADVGIDLTGGYYDAGDGVKFGLPMAASMTLLGWGVTEYRDAYTKMGQLDEALDAIKWGTDYILKAHITENGKTKAFYGQVGQGDLDHSYWGPVEDMTMARPAFKIDSNNPGSDLAGESAAALAAASIAFKPTNKNYSSTLLENAIQLFEFADTHRGKYSDSIPDAANYYNSWSGYYDELAWSATWLYKATGETDYLDKAQSYYQQHIGGLQQWTHSWDNKSYGTAVLLSQETNNSQYRQDVEGWLDYWSNDKGGGIQYTAGGLAWRDQWGSLRYTANTSFLAGIYSDTVNDKNGRYSDFAQSQIDYILGDNPNNFSYVVGFGDDFPLQPHHRSSHGGSWADFNSSAPNDHILYGALVGGPSKPDDNAYTDDRTDYIANEVALDYNAAFTGAVTRLYGELGGTPLGDGVLSQLTNSDMITANGNDSATF